MTREDAIQVLQTALTSPFIYGEYADAIGMAIEALTYEPCDKDAISRAGLLKSWEELSPRGRLEFDQVIMTIPALPSADRPTDEWCTDCKEYDHKKHCCPRFNRVIRATLDEVVRCEDCRHANECHKSVQYTRNEPRTVTMGYSPIEWCSRGERKEPKGFVADEWYRDTFKGEDK